MLYADVFESGSAERAAQVLAQTHVRDLEPCGPPLPASLLDKKGFILDMDGVLYHQNHLLPGAAELIALLKRHEKRVVFLTNSSDRTPEMIRDKMARLGVLVDAKAIYTSALATAEFLKRQSPGASAYVIGDVGIRDALIENGLCIVQDRPDYGAICGRRSCLTRVSF